MGVRGRRGARRLVSIVFACAGQRGGGSRSAWADAKRNFNGDGQRLRGSYLAWKSAAGDYWISVTKNVAGDVNGDGPTS